jgi:hypothetical protein
MARKPPAGGAAPKKQKPKKQGRLAQLRAVFAMTRKSDPAVVWWMLLALVGITAVAFGIGLAIGHEIYVTVVGFPMALLAAMVILARRAERAAYSQLAGQAGAAGAAMSSLRRGWNVEQQPVAVDPRTQDLVFRAVGRPGVVLVTEGPSPRVGRLVEQERKRVSRVLPNVPVHVLNAGDGEGQVPLRKIPRTITKLKPALSKGEVSEVSKRLRALGAARPPIPKGVDPLRVRPDRRATRGR